MTQLAVTSHEVLSNVTTFRKYSRASVYVSVCVCVCVCLFVAGVADFSVRYRPGHSPGPKAIVWHTLQAVSLACQ